MHMRSMLIAMALVLMVPVVPCAGQGTANPCQMEWRQRFPSLRTEHATAFDTRRNVLVLFGGNDGTGYDGSLGDTWEWDGQNWTLRGTSGPAPRYGHAMTFDSVRGVVVLFGGRNYAGAFGDAWEWDGRSWSLRSVSGPLPRHNHSLVFDASRSVTVLFAGQNSNGLSPAGDTWDWNGSTWALRSTIGPRARHSHAMVFDPIRGTMLLFGGRGFPTEILGDTWEWNGSGNGTWSQFPIHGPRRYGHVMAFSNELGKTILFGGRSDGYSDQTWAFDRQAAQWMRMATPSTPSVRFYSAMAYDPHHHRLLMFGGQDDFRFGDLWGLQFGQNDWSLLFTQPAIYFGAEIAYDSQRKVTVLFGARRLPGPGETWEWDGDWWTLRSTIGPEGRGYHGLAYDSQRHVTVMFGGTLTGSENPSRQTWEWDGSDWHLRSKTSPAPRWGFGIAYDSNRGVTTIFGGTDNNSNSFGDCWEWNGQSWVQRLEVGPVSRRGPAMTFDAARGQTVLYGGARYDPAVGNQLLSDLWEWDGALWQLRPYTFGPGQPGGVMAYDGARRVSTMLCATGCPGTTTTWEWNGSIWSIRPAASPSDSGGHAMAFDANRNAMVLWLGDVSSATWEFSIGTQCAADVNHDGVVDIDDLIAIIANWGTCPPLPETCPADVNANGTVDCDDLVQVIANWS